MRTMPFTPTFRGRNKPKGATKIFSHAFNRTLNMFVIGIIEQFTKATNEFWQMLIVIGECNHILICIHRFHLTTLNKVVLLLLNALRTMSARDIYILRSAVFKAHWRTDTKPVPRIGLTRNKVSIRYLYRCNAHIKNAEN